MGKKSRLKAIKNLANRLPLINQTSTEKHFDTGAEILEWDTVKEIDGNAGTVRVLGSYPVALP